MPFTINSKSVVLFGQGVSEQVGEKLKEFGCRRIICIYDEGVKNAGIVDPIINVVEKQNIAVIHFNGVLVDPPDTMINECGKLARKEHVDGVLGIGGGSSLDTAKAVNVLIANPGPIDKYLGPGNLHNPSKPLVLVPTTAGSASEITFVSVVTDTQSGTKIGVAGPATTASLAVVDPLLTIGMPPSLTACTGMDTFAHAFEAYTSKMSNLMSDALSEKSLALVIENLPKAVNDGNDIEARTQMSFACIIAGMSFTDSMLHLGHAFGHTLGSLYHVPHGIGCAIAQPSLLDMITEVMPDKVRRLGELFGLTLNDSLSIREISDTVASVLIEFIKKIGIPTLKDLGVREADLEKLAEETMKDVCYNFVPKELTYEDVLAVVKKAYLA